MTIRERLERIVPESGARGDWERVLADARRSQRRRASLLVPAAVAIAAGVLALAWPFGSERSGGVLDRALAAIGDGPVLHVVYRGDWGVTYADLRTGKVTPVVGQSELWYEPRRGVHYVSRLGSKVLSDTLLPPRRVTRWQESEFLALAKDYRSALTGGEAKVIGPGRVGTRQVLWVRLKERWFPDARDGRYHLFAEEMAIDRSTYEPVYARSTVDGKGPRGSGRTIAELERVSLQDADFEVDDPDKSPEGVTVGAEYGKALRPGRFDAAVGGAAFWLGPTYNGNRLADAREFLVRRRTSGNAPWKTTRGLYLFYGKLRRRGDLPLRALSKQTVILEEFRNVPPFWISVANAAAVREGSVLFSTRGSGLLLRDGTYISIRAPSVREVLEAAAVLRRSDTTATPPSDVDFARMARRVVSHTVQGPEVTGGKPVKPRPIVRRRGHIVQTGSSNGITVRVFSGGVIQFDLRRMDRRLKSLVPRTLSWHCFRIRGDDFQGGGSGGALPRAGVKTVVPLGWLPRGRMRPLRPPFAGCELGTGFGRNWLAKFSFHGVLELPLTAGGRRYFAERAAARELGYFIRTGAMKRARARMRAGAAAPEAGRLEDPSRPYITVTSGGNRIRVQLRASTGRLFFAEILGGGVRRTNAKRLAAAYLR